MIIETILRLLAEAVSGLLTAILPVSPVTLSAAGALMPYYSWLNSWLPVSEALELATLTMGITVIVGGIYVATWLLTKLHILGGSS